MTDPRLDAVLQPALGRIRGVVSGVLDQAVVQLAAQAAGSTSNLQRQLLMTADRELRLKAGRLKPCFERELNALVDGCLQSNPDTSPNSLANTDWASLSLVDNAQVERDVQADRLALTVTHACERPLEAVASYIAGLLDDANPERNPLRPKLVTKALLDSLIQVGIPEDVTQAIAAQLPPLLGPALATCYEQIANDMRGAGLQAQGMAVQKARNSGAMPLGADARRTEPPPLAAEPITTRPSALHARAAHALGEMFGVTMPDPSYAVGDGDTVGGGLSSGAPISVDFQNLLRQISRQAGEIGKEAMAAAGLGGAGAHHDAGLHVPGFAGPLMAINQIRANREELVRASGGAALDKMVIDIVAALFDQVLSDPKVAPEMARQIARLQMPVLRVALGDMNFFNSRKHPVRRFVNRIASLSAAFDDYSQGPGADCLSRITSLVNDIVDGDFDRMDLYETKLRELEAFIEAETAQDAADSADIAALLSTKEADLRVQQRYMQMLQRELLDVELPDFL
mgnify:FL=1